MRDETLTLTVTNSHLTEERETEITVRGAPVGEVTVTTLTALDVRDHNSFEAPDTVVPATALVHTSGSPFVHRFPAASVTKLEIELRR